MDSREKSDLAAEFALGLLDGRARRAAERRLRRDPTFRAEVQHWQAHLTALIDAPPTPPPPGALKRIDERLFGHPWRYRLHRLAGHVDVRDHNVQIAALVVVKAGLLAAVVILLL